MEKQGSIAPAVTFTNNHRTAWRRGEQILYVVLSVFMIEVPAFTSIFLFHHWIEKTIGVVAVIIPITAMIIWLKRGKIAETVQLIIGFSGISLKSNDREIEFPYREIESYRVIKSQSRSFRGSIVYGLSIRMSGQFYLDDVEPDIIPIDYGLDFDYLKNAIGVGMARARAKAKAER